MSTADVVPPNAVVDVVGAVVLVVVVELDAVVVVGRVCFEEDEHAVASTAISRTSDRHRT
jgi:hypothetical protein